MQLCDLDIRLGAAWGSTLFASVYRMLTVHAERPCLGVRKGQFLSEPTTAEHATERAEVPARGFECRSSTQISQRRLAPRARNRELAFAGWWESRESQ